MANAANAHFRNAHGESNGQETEQTFQSYCALVAHTVKSANLSGIDMLAAIRVHCARLATNLTSWENRGLP